MSSLADTIHAHLQIQWADGLRLKILYDCHIALLAVLDEHQPCEPPRQLLCNGCHHMRPCPTEIAIGNALGIKAEL